MRHGLVAAFVLIQLALPGSYYFREDRLDERFAWRMFSSVRTVGCSVRLFDVDAGRRTQLRLMREVHVVWRNLMSRGRRPILEAFAGKWCAENPGHGLEVDIECSTPASLSAVICRAGPGASGVPAAYRDPQACEGLDPEACFRAECGERSASDCYQATCRTRPYPEGTDLCAEGAR